MRILHAIHSYLPESRGGIETYVQLLAQAQRSNGADAAVLAGIDRPAGRRGVQPEDTIAGVPVRRMAVAAPGPDWPDGNARDDEALRSTLSDSAPDLLHVHHWHNLSLRLIGIARSLGVPAVVTLHDLFATCPLFFRLPDAAAICAPDLPVAACARCLARLVPHGEAILGLQVAARHQLFVRELTLARAVLALSVPQQQFLQRVPWLPVAVRALPLPPPPVPLPRIRWTPRTDGRLRLVNWGGLVPGKGLRTLVLAAESLPDAAGIDIDHFGRVLDEAHAAELRSLAQRTRLRLCGPYDEEVMADVFPGYDAMVFPSLYLETHGFVVDEAMALGLPVVVTDRGAPQLRVGARGRVVPAGDVAALAAVLAELRHTPEVLVAMRAAAPPLQPTWQAHVAELQACYATALAEG